MTRTTTRLRRRAIGTAFAMAAALTVGLLPAAPAQADGVGPFFLHVDRAAGDGIAFADYTGAAKAAVTTGLQASRFDASTDGSVVAVSAFSGTPALPDADVAGGLLVSVNGATRLLSTYTDTGPVVSADGASVWFVTDGDLYRFTTAGTAVTRVTTHGEFFPPTQDHFLTSISVSPAGDRIAAVYRRFDTSDKVDTSKVTVSTIGASPATLFTTAYTGAGSAEAFYDRPAWLDDDHVAYGECADGACDTWRWKQVDLSAAPVTDTYFDGPDNLYDLRSIGTTWFAWKDSGTGSALTTELYVSTDQGVSFSRSGTARTDAASSVLYVPVTAAPTSFSGLTSANPATSEASLLLSTGKVSTGGSAVYLAYDYYLRAVGAQSFDSDADTVQRGVLSYSTDGRKTWKVLRTTSGATKVAFPGLPFPGNGRTQGLTRNTYFRWSYTGDAFAAAATSTTELVTVSPTITAKAKKKGSKRVVSGTVKRAGGTIVLYKGSKKLGKAKIGSTGAFKFKALKLAKGSYKLKTASDASWAASSKKLKV